MRTKVCKSDIGISLLFLNEKTKDIHTIEENNNIYTLFKNNKPFAKDISLTKTVMILDMLVAYFR